MKTLSPAHLAVVTIDVQVGLFCTNPPPFEASEVINRINSVTGKARAAHVPIIFVQHDGPPEGNWLVPKSREWQIHPDLVRAADDLVVRKTTGDAFYSTLLETTLRSRGIQSLVLMGYATDFCVDSTLRNAASKEFAVFVISDAHTTNDAPTLKATQIRQHFNWIWQESSSNRGIHVLSAAEIQFSDKD